MCVVQINAINLSTQQTMMPEKESLWTSSFQTVLSPRHLLESITYYVYSVQMVGNLRHIISIKTLPKDDASLSKGALSLSSSGLTCPSACGCLPAYVFFLLNHACSATIKKITINAAADSTCDTSPLLRFHFWKPISFNSYDNTFPSNSIEE